MDSLDFLDTVILSLPIQPYLDMRVSRTPSPYELTKDTWSTSVTLHTFDHICIDTETDVPTYRLILPCETYGAPSPFSTFSG